MQIKDINIIEALHKALAHPPKGWIIQVAMISDESQNTIASLLDTPLCKADKLDIIIIEPFRVAFAEGLPSTSK